MRNRTSWRFSGIGKECLSFFIFIRPQSKALYVALYECNQLATFIETRCPNCSRRIIINPRAISVILWKKFTKNFQSYSLNFVKHILNEIDPIYFIFFFQISKSILLVTLTNMWNTLYNHTIMWHRLNMYHLPCPLDSSFMWHHMYRVKFYNFLISLWSTGNKLYYYS